MAFLYNDIFQDKFEKDLIKIYTNYEKNFDKNIIKKIKNVYDKEASIKFDYFPLIKYSIRNGQVTINDFVNVKKYFNDNSDQRYLNNFNLLAKTLKWAKKNNLEIPNTTIYIWISDRFPWYTEDLEKFPIWVYARPENIDLPIFPDNTFDCLQMDDKYKGICYDWDSVKKIIKKKCKNKIKENIIYFKGTPTTRRTHKLREDLQKYQKDHNIPIKVLLDAWETYEPLYKFCEYLYLFNLPGHYPWSNRLKYLFLMDSVVINVNVNTINIKPEYKDPPYISLIDYIIDKKDYIEILYNYYRVGYKFSDDKDIKEQIDSLQKKEFDKFIIKLQEIFNKMLNNPTKYKKIATGAKNKVNILTNERIYQYIYKGILLNSRFIT